MISLMAGLLAVIAPRSDALTSVAKDDSSQAVYTPSWDTGDDGGYGFGPWSIYALGANAGSFQGTAAGNDAGGGPYPHYIDAGGDSFGLWANTASRMAAYRGIDVDGDGAIDQLGLGSLFHWEMDNGGVDQVTSSVGLSLRTGNATGDANDSTILAGRRFGFEFLQGNANYSIIDSTGVRDTGIGWRRTGLGMDFVLTGLDSYYLRVLDIASGAVLSNYYGSLGGSAGATLNSFVIYNRFAGADLDRDLYFNSFEILAVPEPSTVLLFVGGLGLVWASWRKRK
jgi:hypothetical protein